MIKKKYLHYYIFAALLMLFGSGFRTSNYPGKKIENIFSDTSSFVPNAADGWSILSCYLNQDTPDSVEFELILKQVNSPDWTTEQFIGTITNPSFIPQHPQQGLNFSLLFNNIWKVKVLSNGKCYFKLKVGSVPEIQQGYVMLPFKVRYKNN